MQRKTDSLAAHMRPSTAANEEFDPAVADLSARTRAPVGWDPYEVWRTRIKPALDRKDLEGSTV